MNETQLKIALEKKADELRKLIRGGRMAIISIEPNPDPADQNQFFEARELDLENLHINTAVLHQIHGALQRLKNGTYGVCEECDGPISQRRLDALPYATRCVRCQQEVEHVQKYPNMSAVTA